MLKVTCSALCSFMHVMDMKTSSPVLIRIERNFNAKSVPIPINDNDLFSKYSDAFSTNASLPETLWMMTSDKEVTQV